MSTSENPYKSGFIALTAIGRKIRWSLAQTIILTIVSALTVAYCVFAVTEYEVTSRSLMENERCIPRTSERYFDEQCAILRGEFSKYQSLFWSVYGALAGLNLAYVAVLFRVVRTINQPRSPTLLYAFLVPGLSPGLIFGIPFAAWILHSAKRG